MPRNSPPDGGWHRSKGSGGGSEMNELLRPIELLRPAAVEFGAGTVVSVGRWAEARGFRRTLVVADAFNAQRVGALELRGEAIVFDGVAGEPAVPDLEKLLAVAEE